MKHWSIRLSLTAFVLIVLLGAFPKIISSPDFIFEKPQKWIHKGYGEYNQYKIYNFIAAHQTGYTGIEFDLTCINNQILVQHDMLVNKESLKLDELLPVLDSLDMYYWIDLKTGFDKRNNILLLTNALNEFPNLKNRTIIECGTFSGLHTFKQQNYRITYRIRQYSGNLFNQGISFIKNCLIITLSNPNAIAIDAKNINPYTHFLYSNQNKMIWNTDELQSKYLNDYSIKVALETKSIKVYE